MPETADLVVQYLHSFPRKDPLAIRKGYMASLKTKAPRNIFITAYKKNAEIMQSGGFEAYYVPMTVDTHILPTHAPVYDDRVLWFGRVDSRKREVFNKCKVAARKNGYRFDYISGNKFNGKGAILTQPQIWNIARKYRYGVAVGRCALEMLAIGLKVLIAGPLVGGLIMNDGDYETQRETNMNGRLVTLSNDLDTCFKHLPESKTGYKADCRDIVHADVVREVQSY